MIYTGTDPTHSLSAIAETSVPWEKEHLKYGTLGSDILFIIVFNSLGIGILLSTLIKNFTTGFQDATETLPMQLSPVLEYQAITAQSSSYIEVNRTATTIVSPTLELRHHVSTIKHTSS